jgi:hypothetical protein
MSTKRIFVLLAIVLLSLGITHMVFAHGDEPGTSCHQHPVVSNCDNDCDSDDLPCISPSPSPSPSPTASATPSATPTKDPTSTWTPTPTISATPSATVTASPTMIPAWVPGTDNCEVYNNAFRKLPDLPFGIVGWSIAGYAKFDAYTPNKRGLVFNTGTLNDGMQLFLSNWVYTVHIRNGMIACVDTTPATSTPAPTNTLATTLLPPVVSLRNGNTFTSEARRDPDFWVIGRFGTIFHDQHFLGSNFLHIPCEEQFITRIDGVKKTYPPMC